MFQKACCIRNPDVLMPGDVSSSGRTLQGTIFPLLGKSFIEPVYYKHIRLCLQFNDFVLEFLGLL